MSSTSEQNCEVQLAAEIEVLKGALADKHSQLLAMESACLQESDRQVELEDSIIAWQDKYERLYESHKRVQKLNQNLEDKLLKLVDRNSGERAQLTSDVATLSVRLAQANYNIQSLKREIERYKTDISVAIQLLQCKPDSFVSPKLSSLPIEIQSKVATYMRLETNSHSDSEGSTSGVGMATAGAYHVLPASDSPPPLCPFPPTAMVYSMRGLDGNQDSQKEQHQQVAGGKQHASNSSSSSSHQQQSPPEATLVPRGSAHINTANSTDSLLGDSRSVAPPNGQSVVSPSVMAKFLEDELKSSDALLLGTPIKHCDTCLCTRNAPAGDGDGAGSNEGSLLLADLLGSEQKYYSVATQTLIKGETNNSLCLRCNSNLNSPSHNNSPYIMKLIKSSDSVISETKSSVSDYLTTPDKVSPTTGGGGPTGAGPGVVPGANGELLPGGGILGDAPPDPLSALLVPPAKKDDLMVNPIMGHHRLSGRHDPAGAIDQHALLLGKGASAPFGSSAKLPPVSSGRKGPPPPPAPPAKPAPAQMTPPERGASAAPTGLGSRAESKFAHDSPSYIIKDTDQMSGSHTTPKSSTGNGALAQAGAKYGTSASGSVGSGLYHTVGSTNSLWSRTSSKDPEKDGARMFEIFNRNLIKTIKAENPKMCGPRICALRIQNGSSNILLDNLVDDALEGVDSKPPTPVMYTRRAKFLDEELLLDDDPSIGLNGAIKTTNLPTATSSSGDSGALGGATGEKLAVLTPSKQGGGGSATAGGAGGGDGATERHGPLASGTIDRVDEGGGGGGGGGADGGGSGPADGGGKQVCNMSTTTSPHSSDRLCTIGEEVSNLLINTKLGPAAMLPKPARLDISVNKLDGLDVTSKKSCTQSSSISGEINIQESAILRRQQLSRVAEWVQNNSKLGNAEPLGHAESDHEPAAGLSRALTDSLNNNAPAAPNASTPRAPALEGHKPSVASDAKLGRGAESPFFSRGAAQPTGRAHHANSTLAQHAGPGAPGKAPGGGGGGAGKHGYSNNLNSGMAGAFKGTTLDYNSNATGTTTAGTAASSGSTIHPAAPFQCSASSASGAIRKGTYGPYAGLLRDSALTECLIREVNQRLASETDGAPAPAPPPEDDDSSSSIDLAQMEYNVKQFLLKQNEWSTVQTRRPSLISSTASSVKGRPGEERPSTGREGSSARGLFPGTAVAQTAHYHHSNGVPSGAGLSSGGLSHYGTRSSNKYPINPHRTETNL